MRGEEEAGKKKVEKWRIGKRRKLEGDLRRQEERILKGTQKGGDVFFLFRSQFSFFHVYILRADFKRFKSQSQVFISKFQVMMQVFQLSTY